MAETPSQDLVLRKALADLHEYDEAAVQAKAEFRLARRLVLYVVTLGTITALLTSYFEDNQHVSIVLLTAATLLPVFSSFLISDIQLHSRTTTWLTFRVIAERIRGQVWLYRMGAGEYGNRELEERDNLLIEEIRAKNLTLGTKETVSVAAWKKGARDSENWVWQLIAPVLQWFARLRTAEVEETDAVNSEPGWYAHYAERFQLDEEEFEIEKYVNDRGRYQIAWYEKNIGEHASDLRNLTRLSQVLLFVGAIFPILVGIFQLPVELIAMAALTNILSYSVATWTDVAMFGQTPGLYNIAKDELKYLLGKWEAHKNDKEYGEKKEEIQRALITEIEQTLAWEREKWFESLLQTASSVDDNFFKALEELQRSEKYRSVNYWKLPSQQQEPLVTEEKSASTGEQ